MKLIKPERLSLKSHPELSEKWLQDHIAEDPTLLGLGDLVLRDRERVQPRAGRLDLLLVDPDTLRRYEVELQLGATDESHLIRTIEYWDIERKRYPQYDHCAVIVAEDITSRFLNVISLFNSSIPLIAIQLSAIRVDDGVALMFTTVLDEMTLGLVDDDEEVSESADRPYWENRGTAETVSIADRLLEIIRQWDSGFSLKYNKHYIGLEKGGSPNNFVLFKAKKGHLTLEARVAKSDEIDKRIDDAELDTLPYTRHGRYRVSLTKRSLEQHEELIAEIIKRAYEG
jgi:hypothetical protein